MREMILVLEHTQANPIVVDEDTAVKEGSREELEIDVRATLPQRSQCIVLRLPKAS